MQEHLPTAVGMEVAFTYRGKPKRPTEPRYRTEKPNRADSLNATSNIKIEPLVLKWKWSPKSPNVESLSGRPAPSAKPTFIDMTYHVI